MARPDPQSELHASTPGGIKTFGSSATARTTCSDSADSQNAVGRDSELGAIRRMGKPTIPRKTAPGVEQFARTLRSDLAPAARSNLCRQLEDGPHFEHCV